MRMSSFQKFVQKIGVRAIDVPADEFEMAFREESLRLSGAAHVDGNYDDDALEEMVYYWNHPVDLEPRTLVLNYERTRAWVELLRREIKGA